jgi:hypothetical protein
VAGFLPLRLGCGPGRREFRFFTLISPRVKSPDQFFANLGLLIRQQSQKKGKGVQLSKQRTQARKSQPSGLAQQRLAEEVL